MKTPTERREQRVRAAAKELRFTEGADDTAPRVSGYAAVFNTPSQVLGSPRSQYRFIEILKPGAFSNALKNSADVMLNVEHEEGQILADLQTRTLILIQDDTGLFFDAELDPADPDVQRILPKLKRGTVRGMSFAFTVAEDGDEWVTTENDSGTETVRTISDIDALYDVALVTRPAYPDTTVALRSLESWKTAGAAAAAGVRAGINSDLLRRRIALAECE